MSALVAGSVSQSDQRAAAKAAPTAAPRASVIRRGSIMGSNLTLLRPGSHETTASSLTQHEWNMLENPDNL